MKKVELVVDLDALLAESPCWDDRTGLLYCIDILGEKIYQYNSQNNFLAKYTTGQMIGCIALREKSGLLCAMQNGIYGFDPRSGNFEKLLIRPDHELTDNRFNDGKCDPAGRFFVGTMSNKGNEGAGDPPPVGTLYKIDPDLEVQAMISKVSISNGMAWNSRLDTLYYIDTPTRKVVAYDYDIKTGCIDNGRTVIDFRNESGNPDGMTIDSEDNLWIAHWGGWKLSKWHPELGIKMQEIRLPCQNVTCCAFGGQNYDLLYITTARTGLDFLALSEQSHAGSLFCIKTDVPGIPSYRFKG